MENSESSVIPNSAEKFRFVDLKLPTLHDQNINSEVQNTHSNDATMVLREPLRVSICHILKPATTFLDSILLGNKESENGNDIATFDLSEFNSTLSELSEVLGDRCFDFPGFLEGVQADTETEPKIIDKIQFSKIFNLKSLAEDYAFMTPIRMMEKAGENFVMAIMINHMNMIDENNLHMASMNLLEFLSCLSWEAKALTTMGCFVFKCLEFLGHLLHGPNQALSKISSSMEELKENHVSLMGTPLEKFQVPIDQLNRVIKLILEAMELISDLTLLSDTKYGKEELLATSVYWVILCVVACYFQVSMVICDCKMALELSQVISNLSHIVNDLKHHWTMCKPQIEEMDAHLVHIAFFENTFAYVGYKEGSLDASIEMLELMKSFLYSNDCCHSIIDGSTMTTVDLEVLKEKAVILFISTLDINPERLTYIQGMYEQMKEDNYYKIVWVPYVLEWTEELRQKFQDLKSNMPWYIVSYNSPIAGVWYTKGRRLGKQSFLEIDLQHGHRNPIPFASVFAMQKFTSFPFKRPRTLIHLKGGGGMPSLSELYKSELHEEDANPNTLSNGFQGLIAKIREVRQSKN